MLDDGLRQLSVRLPAGLLRRVKVVAAREGKSVTEIVGGLLEAYLKARELPGG